MGFDIGGNMASQGKMVRSELKQELSALDAYLNRVFKIAILAPSIATLTAAIYFTVLKAAGWYPNIPIPVLVIFDIMDVSFLVTSIWFMKTSFAEDGILKREKLRMGKAFCVVVIIVQWNAISYMSPMREWWAFMFFFAAFGMLFFDMKMMFAAVVGVSASTFISWAVMSDLFIGMSDDPLKEAVVRVICVIWTMSVLLLITYFGSKFLVEELEKYANFDTLTHLLNRRSMDNYLQEAYRQANTGKSSFCLLMADIDDFKKVNDTYGHDCGDEVLKYVAQTISTGVKKTDNVFRWGGEEICILLNTDEERAVAAAERIRKDIEHDRVNYRNEASVSVTVTMGVSPYRDGMTIQAMMDDADAKLYWGKQHGKNQVVNVLPQEPKPSKKEKKGKSEDDSQMPETDYSALMQSV